MLLTFMEYKGSRPLNYKKKYMFFNNSRDDVWRNILFLFVIEVEE